MELLIWRVGLFIAIVCNVVEGKTLLNSTTGGYTGLVIGIDKNTVNTMDVEILIEYLKDLLTMASQTLHEATHGRLFFQQVTILVPVDDDGNENIFGSADPIRPAESGEVYDLADIRVSTAGFSTDLFPRTSKRGDCGEPGDFIHLTSDYLMHTKNATFVKRYGDPAKELVKQWGLYRFGLFEENDPTKFYFHPERGAYEPTYCSNAIVNGSRLDFVTGLRCVEDDHFPSKDCRFIVGDVGNDNVTSSLLFRTKLPHVVEFCNETTHNRYAPTMQNIRCEGKSAWEVMLKHNDFLNDLGRVTFSPPEFHLVNSNHNASIVIIIDRNIFTINESAVSVSDPVLSSLRKYILFVAPDGTSLEVSIVNATDHTFPLQMTIRDHTDRIALLETIDYLLFNDSSSLIIHNDLNNEEERELPMWRNGVVMFIVATEKLTGNWSNRLDGAHFSPVFVNVTIDDSLIRIADDTDGKVYALRGGLLSLEVDLDAVFLDALGRFTDAHDIVQISGGVMNINANFPDTFIVDLRVANYMKVVVTVIMVPEDTTDIPSEPTRQILAQESVVVVSPSIIYGDASVRLVAFESSTESRGFITFQLTDAQPGVWSLRRGPGYFPETTIVVFQVFAVLPGRNAVRSLPAITTLAKLDRTTVGERALVIPRLSVSVMQGDHMKTTATNVAAKVYPPHGGYSVMSLVLEDDGKGADVIAGDGIYSVFLTNISEEGIYRVVPIVYGGDGLACLIQRSLGCFQRSSSPLYVTATDSIQDDFKPPSAVKDLFLIGARREESSTIVTLKWTSPGDNYDDGIVSGYELRYFTEWLAASNFTNSGMNVMAGMVVRGSLSTAKPAGSAQVLSVRLPTLPPQHDANGSKGRRATAMFMVLRAFDEVGNFGSPSNIVSVPVFDSNNSTTNNKTTSVFPISTMNATSATTIDVDNTMSTTATPTSTTLLQNSTDTVFTGISDHQTGDNSSSIRNSHSHDGVIASAILLFFALIILTAVCIHTSYFSKKSKRNNFSYEEFQIGDRVASRIEH